MSTPPVWLRLQGAPQAGRDGEPGHALERKDAAWLAVLALEGSTPRDQLAAWLWPDATRITAAGSLRQRVFRLRRRLKHELVHAAERIVLLPAVQLLADEDGPDLLAGSDYTDCPDFADWLARQRHTRHTRRLDTLTAAAARQEAAGELAAALDTVHRLLALDPLAEHAQRRLMRVHYLRGDRAAALTAFEHFERLLKDELGVRPNAETLQLLAVVESAAPVAAPRRSMVPASLVRPPRLVGRQRELDGLTSAWAAGRIALVMGEAGMGKSRLLAELVTGHAGTSLHVAARPGDAAVPFALLARLLRAVRARCRVHDDAPMQRELARVLPELGLAAGLTPTGDGQRLLLQRAVEWLLREFANAGGQELLVDDLHFADAASLEMLLALLLSDTAPPLRWGLSQRPAEGGPAALALRDALADAQRLHTLPLAPLDVMAMHELVDSLGLPMLDAAALAGPLVRHTGGNPLFALETLKDLVLRGHSGQVLPQPASVEALIERRLRALSPAALSLARVAVVGGVDFGIELAAEVLGCGPLALADPWSELQAAQVLSGATFAHDLVADAVARTLPGEIARHVHGQVAAWLAQRAAEPARVAEHWFAAARWPEAAACFERACQHARRAGRIGDALALHERRLLCWHNAGDDAQSWQSELDAIELLVSTRGPAHAGQTAQRLVDTAPTGPSRAASLAGLALVQMHEMRWAEARDTATEALALADASALPGVQLNASRILAMALAVLGEPAIAVRQLRALRAAVDREGSLRQRYEHHAALAYVLNLLGQPAATAEELREAIRLAQQAGDSAEVMSSLNNLAACEVSTGHLEDAWQHGLQAQGMQEHTGLEAGPHGLILDMNLGIIAAQTGRYNEALVRLERALVNLAPLGPGWVAAAHNHLAALWLVLGQPHRAEATLGTAPDTSHVTVQRRQVILRARLASRRGAVDVQALEAALKHYSALPDTKDNGSLALELSRACSSQRALVLVRQVRREALEAGLSGLALHALMREVDLLVAVDPGHAAALAAELQAHDPAVSATDAYAPERHWVLARAANAVGNEAEGRRQLAAARAWINTAAEAMAPGLRRAFRDHNPVNAAVLQAAGQ